MSENPPTRVAELRLPNQASCRIPEIETPQRSDSDIHDIYIMYKGKVM